MNVVKHKCGIISDDKLSRSATMKKLLLALVLIAATWAIAANDFNYWDYDKTNNDYQTTAQYIQGHCSNEQIVRIVRETNIPGDHMNFKCWYGSEDSDNIWIIDNVVMINGFYEYEYNKFSINVFFGFDGDDEILTGDGVDVIYGDEGNDILSGGKSDGDYIFTGSGINNIAYVGKYNVHAYNTTIFTHLTLTDAEVENLANNGVVKICVSNDVGCKNVRPKLQPEEKYRYEYHRFR
jgi:Ca2+-binding RTX toxin-like protein